MVSNKWVAQPPTRKNQEGSTTLCNIFRFLDLQGSSKMTSQVTQHKLHPARRRENDDTAFPWTFVGSQLPPKSSHAGHWEEAMSPIEDLRRRPAVTESSAVFSRYWSKWQGIIDGEVPSGGKQVHGMCWNTKPPKWLTNSFRTCAMWNTAGDVKVIFA